MNTRDMDVPAGWESASPVIQHQQLRAALITTDDPLREIVFESVQAAGIPLRIDLEIAARPPYLDPEHLERLRSSEPQVVILDMADDPEGAIRVAGAVASSCPRAAIVGVGPELEAPRLLEAMRAGLVEYVQRPVEAPSIRDALARLMRKRGWADAHEGQRNGKLLAFFSAKGGTGSTSVVTNVGVELHRLTGKKTLLVDLDLELGEIASLLGVKPRFHFVDLVRNFHRMDADLLPSYIESHESGVQVLSAPFEPELSEEVTGEQIARILGFLRRHYDYVLVDTSKSLGPPALAALQMADPIFLITNLDVPSLRNLKRCLPVLDKVTAGDAARLRLVVNRLNPKSLVRIQDLEEALGIEVYWTLSNDYQTVIHSISTGQPLVLHGGSRYAEQLKELARDVAGTPRGTTPSRKSLVRRLLSPLRSPSTRARPTLTSDPMEAPTHG
ncbi:MAG: AAA family ATPase [Gemmatimonadetes bacterium]|nr:AAA family ATPase [Gemmatimonadota bacterium]